MRTCPAAFAFLTVANAWALAACGPEEDDDAPKYTIDDGPLAGTKLVGFSLWKSPDGEIYVTFPSRAFGAGSERRYFDYLRSVEGTADAIKSVKAWILDEYRKVEAAA